MTSSASAFPKLWTVDDFLGWEELQEERYEFVQGMIRAMTGGSLDHATIIGNVAGTLRDRLRGGPCKAYASEVKVKAADSAMYPDVLIHCGPVDPKATVVTDPVVVVEVLSKSTDDYDRGRKWLAYQTIPELTHFLLVSQDECRIDVYRRMGNGWFTETIGDMGAEIALASIGARLSVAEIYEGSSVAQRMAS